MTEDPLSVENRFKVLEDRLDKKYRSVVLALAIGGVILMVGMVTGWSLVSSESQKRADAIQKNRYEATRDSCRDSNDRNRETILRLSQTPNTGPAARRQTPEELRANIAQAKFLIDALVPFRPDCEGYAKSRTSTP